MTGYGKGINGNFKVEVRSLNYRNLEVLVKVPAYLYFYEPEIRKLVKKYFSRGRIEILVSTQQTEGLKFKINKSLAKEFYNTLVSLKDELAIPGDIGIDILASQREIFLPEESEVELLSFHAALEAAIEDLKKMRIEEGKNLIADVIERANTIRKGIDRIEDKRAWFVVNAKKALTERLRTILEDTPVDESRLIQEVAILIEKSDITEELVRIKSHLKYMEDTLGSEDSAGRKMEFLAQELQRELNTIGSKTASTEISTIVIELKAETEKIKEQVQNLQ